MYSCFIQTCCVASFDSTTFATSPWQTAQRPTSSKFPDLTAPEKLVIVDSRRQLPHHTLAMINFRESGGIAFHSLAAGVVKWGRVSTVMITSGNRIDALCCGFPAVSNLAGKINGKGPRQERSRPELILGLHSSQLIMLISVTIQKFA